MSHNSILFERYSECTALIKLTFYRNFTSHRGNLGFGNKQADATSVHMAVKTLIQTKNLVFMLEKIDSDAIIRKDHDNIPLFIKLGCDVNSERPACRIILH